jgi:glyoxylase-like metal-dependent hydrolase (beta-lactamase superfamily II)
MTLHLCGRVHVIAGGRQGRYPDGNTLLVRRRASTVLIDPSLTVAGLPTLPPADVVLLSHAHEDHWAGLFRYRGAEVVLHAADAPAIRSLDTQLAAYGFDEVADSWRAELVARFHYSARADAVEAADGTELSLAGGQVTFVHLPGHTPGHCALMIEPEGVAYLGDIDLSRFGPYYGDRTSSLADFRHSLARCREIDAAWYVTFHQTPPIHDRAGFIDALDAYLAVLDRRSARLLAFLDRPRSIEQIVAHRIVYRPTTTGLFIDAVEARTAQLHLQELAGAGLVARLGNGDWVAHR